MHSLTEQLQQKLAPAVAGLGFDLLCVELVGTGADAILRLYIDSPKGIDVEDCALVSREVSALLDVDDPLDSAYRLEVSSPGLDRPLVRPAHFQEYTGRETKVKLRIGVDGRRNFRGRIVQCDEQCLVLEVDGQVTELPLDDVERARLVPVFD